ncbi:hypothetical protein [Mycobacterium sp. URHD0025]|uniref:hypothetical protein n=1 Tax=Mycobacterium sp. URHD0025 TaxID=1298864 RepID=UPI00048F7023|nr:hypothetical protein [Mycobacterium sp. URHD0025]
MADLRTHRHRIAQCAAGTTGTHGLRSIIEHPHLDLSAVHVFGADRIGVDAGDPRGLKPTTSCPPLRGLHARSAQKPTSCAGLLATGMDRGQPGIRSTMHPPQIAAQIRV